MDNLLKSVEEELLGEIPKGQSYYQEEDSSSLGQKIDELNALKETISKKKSEIDELEKRAELLEQRILEDLLNNGIEKASGTSATVYIRKMEIPIIKDYLALSRWILTQYKENGADFLDLLQKRISPNVWRDYVEKGIQIPGIELYTKTAIGLTKIRK